MSCAMCLRGPPRRARGHRRRHRVRQDHALNLLLRFYDVQRGRITVDGVDIRELDLRELRGLFSLVLQDVHLFSRHDCRQHPARQRGDRRRAGPAGGAGGARRRLHLDAARRLRQRGRRARIDAVGRAEAAAVVRARAGVRSRAS